MKKLKKAWNRLNLITVRTASSTKTLRSRRMKSWNRERSWEIRYPPWIQESIRRRAMMTLSKRSNRGIFRCKKESKYSRVSSTTKKKIRWWSTCPLNKIWSCKRKAQKMKGLKEWLCSSCVMSLFRSDIIIIIVQRN